MPAPATHPIEVSKHPAAVKETGGSKRPSRSSGADAKERFDELVDVEPEKRDAPEKTDKVLEIQEAVARLLAVLPMNLGGRLPALAAPGAVAFKAGSHGPGQAGVPWPRVESQWDGGMRERTSDSMGRDKAPGGVSGRKTAGHNEKSASLLSLQKSRTSEVKQTGDGHSRSKEITTEDASRPEKIEDAPSQEEVEEIKESPREETVDTERPPAREQETSTALSEQGTRAALGQMNPAGNSNPGQAGASPSSSASQAISGAGEVKGASKANGNNGGQAGTPSGSGSGGGGAGGSDVTQGTRGQNGMAPAAEPAPATGPGSTERAGGTSSTLRSYTAHVPRQILQALKQAVKSGQTKLEFQLDPPELGRVKLHLTADGTSLRILLEVGSEVTCHALREALPQIRQMLLGEDFQLAEFDVMYQDSRGDFGAGEGADAWGEEGGESAMAAGRPDDVAAPARSNAAPTNYVFSHQGVNLVA